MVERFAARLCVKWLEKNNSKKSSKSGPSGMHQVPGGVRVPVLLVGSIHHFANFNQFTCSAM